LEEWVAARSAKNGTQIFLITKLRSKALRFSAGLFLFSKCRFKTGNSALAKLYG
jgi:hypothetical protein